MHLLLICTIHITQLTFLQQLYICDGEDALLVSMVTIILVQHQSCKQQLVRMSPCEEEDREEENRREGNRVIFTTCIHDSCLWNVSEHTNCSYNITLCPSSGVNESAVAWTSTPLYKAMPSLELTTTQLHPTHKVKGFHIQHFRHRNLLTDLGFSPNSASPL